MKLVPGHVQRVIERRKDHIPAVRCAIGLRSAQNAGMKGVQHQPVAENKGQRLRLVPLGKVDVEFRRRFQDDSLDGGIDPVVSIQYA